MLLSRHFNYNFSMKLLKGYKVEALVVFVIVVGYLLTRLLTLTQIPIFTDEAIYLRWTQIASQDVNWRFISLTDGKQPLFIWLAIISLRIISDPLVAGRMVSVLAGLATVVGLFFLGREVFRNRWVGIVSACLYTIYPFALIYDRMALYDSVVGTFSVWSLYFTIRFIRNINLESALLLGFLTGGAVLNKTNGFFTIYLLPFALILFDFAKKKRITRLVRFFLLSLVVVVMTYGIYSILRLSPYFYIITQKDAIFVYPLREWITHPFAFVFTNLSGQLDWLLRYTGISIIVFALGSLMLSRQYWREKVLFIIWFLVPFMALALFGRTIYPRYIFFMTLPLLVLSAYSFVVLVERIKSRYLIGLMFVVFFSYSLITSILILKDPANSPIPKADITQYVTSWPAGTGIKESVDFFTQQAKNEKIFIATEGTFGLLPYAYEIYLINNPNITIKGYWPVDISFKQELESMAKIQKTYVVFYQDCPDCVAQGIAPKDWKLKEIFQIKKKDNKSFFTVYQAL